MPRITNAIGLIDDDLISEAVDDSPKTKFGRWIKWGSIAACFCLAVIVFGIIGNKLNWFKPKDDYAVAVINTSDVEPVTQDTDNVEKPIETDNATAIELPDDKISSTDNIINDYAIVQFTTFFLDGNDKVIYYPIKSASSLKRWGLIIGESDMISAENTYKATEKDLGAFIGKVGQCDNEELIGKSVYHFSSYPDNNVICILDNDGEYELYEGYFYDLVFMTNDHNSDIIFSEYLLPEECVEIEVQNDAGIKLYSIIDKELIMEVCSLLSGCGRVSQDETQRRLAQAWYEAYGNDNIYFDEDRHLILYKQIDENHLYPDDNEMEAAQKLWSEGEYCFTIRNKYGFGVFFDFFPAMKGFQCVDGYFDLSDESIQRLNEILEKGDK